MRSNSKNTLSVPSEESQYWESITRHHNVRAVQRNLQKTNKAIVQYPVVSVSNAVSDIKKFTGHSKVSKWDQHKWVNCGTVDSCYRPTSTADALIQAQEVVSMARNGYGVTQYVVGRGTSNERWLARQRTGRYNFMGDEPVDFLDAIVASSIRDNVVIKHITNLYKRVKPQEKSLITRTIKSKMVKSGLSPDTILDMSCLLDNRTDVSKGNCVFRAVGKINGCQYYGTEVFHYNVTTLRALQSVCSEGSVLRVGPIINGKFCTQNVITCNNIVGEVQPQSGLYHIEAEGRNFAKMSFSALNKLLPALTQCKEGPLIASDDAAPSMDESQEMGTYEEQYCTQAQLVQTINQQNWIHYNPVSGDCFESCFMLLKQGLISHGILSHPVQCNYGFPTNSLAISANSNVMGTIMNELPYNASIQLSVGGVPVALITNTVVLISTMFQPALINDIDRVVHASLWFSHNMQFGNMSEDDFTDLMNDFQDANDSEYGSFTILQDFTILGYATKDYNHVVYKIMAIPRKAVDRLTHMVYFEGRVKHSCYMVPPAFNDDEEVAFYLIVHADEHGLTVPNSYLDSDFNVMLVGTASVQNASLSGIPETIINKGLVYLDLQGKWSDVSMVDLSYMVKEKAEHYPKQLVDAQIIQYDENGVLSFCDQNDIDSAVVIHQTLRPGFHVIQGIQIITAPSVKLAKQVLDQVMNGVQGMFCGADIVQINDNESILPSQYKSQLNGYIIFTDEDLGGAFDCQEVSGDYEQEVVFVGEYQRKVTIVQKPVAAQVNSSSAKEEIKSMANNKSSLETKSVKDLDFPLDFPPLFQNDAKTVIKATQDNILAIPVKEPHLVPQVLPPSIDSGVIQIVAQSSNEQDVQQTSSIDVDNLVPQVISNIVLPSKFSDISDIAQNHVCGSYVSQDDGITQYMIRCDQTCPFRDKRYKFSGGFDRCFTGYEKRATPYQQAILLEKHVMSLYDNIADCTAGTGQHVMLNASKTIVAAYDIDPIPSMKNNVGCVKHDIKDAVVDWQVENLFVDFDWALTSDTMFQIMSCHKYVKNIVFKHSPTDPIIVNGDWQVVSQSVFGYDNEGIVYNSFAITVIAQTESSYIPRRIASDMWFYKMFEHTISLAQNPKLRHLSMDKNFNNRMCVLVNLHGGNIQKINDVWRVLHLDTTYVLTSSKLTIGGVDFEIKQETVPEFKTKITGDYGERVNVKSLGTYEKGANTHEVLAQHRRKALELFYTSFSACDQIVFIGGRAPREIAPLNFKRVTYINPGISQDDAMSTNVIRQLIEENKSDQIIKLYQCTLQHFVRNHRQEFLEMRSLGPVLFVSINSIYYIQDNVLELMYPGDVLATMGHVVTARSTIHDFKHVRPSCTTLYAGNYAIKQVLADTPDAYEHQSRSLLDFVQFPYPARHLTLVASQIELQQKTQMHQVIIFRAKSYTEGDEVMKVNLTPGTSNDNVYNLLSSKPGKDNKEGLSEAFMMPLGSYYCTSIGQSFNHEQIACATSVLKTRTGGQPQSQWVASNQGARPMQPEEVKAIVQDLSSDPDAIILTAYDFGREIPTIHTLPCIKVITNNIKWQRLFHSVLSTETMLRGSFFGASTLLGAVLDSFIPGAGVACAITGHHVYTRLIATKMNCVPAKWWKELDTLNQKQKNALLLAHLMLAITEDDIISAFLLFGTKRMKAHFATAHHKLIKIEPLWHTGKWNSGFYSTNNQIVTKLRTGLFAEYKINKPMVFDLTTHSITVLPVGGQERQFRIPVQNEPAVFNIQHNINPHTGITADQIQFLLAQVADLQRVISQQQHNQLPQTVSRSRQTEEFNDSFKKRHDNNEGYSREQQDIYCDFCGDKHHTTDCVYPMDDEEKMFLNQKGLKLHKRNGKPVKQSQLGGQQHQRGQQKQQQSRTFGKGGQQKGAGTRRLKGITTNGTKINTDYKFAPAPGIKMVNKSVVVSFNYFPSEYAKIPQNKQFYFDVEASVSTQIINCMQFMVDDQVLIIHGDSCYDVCKHYLAKLSKAGCTAIVWDQTMESVVYDTCYDLQQDSYVTFSRHSAKQSLKKVAAATGFPRPNLDDISYDSYSLPILPAKSLQYAIDDLYMLHHVQATRPTKESTVNHISDNVILYGDICEQILSGSFESAIHSGVARNIMTKMLNQKFNNSNQYYFMDVGEGSSHEECGAAVALYNITGKANSLTPFKDLQKCDPKFYFALRPNKGVTINQIASYSAQRYGSYAIFTSYTVEGYFERYTPHQTLILPLKDSILWFIHAGHAFAVTVDVAKQYRAEENESIMPKQDAKLFSKYVNRAFGSAQLNYKTKYFKITGGLDKCQLKSWKHGQIIKSRAIPINTEILDNKQTGGKVLTGKCMGCPNLVLNSDQCIQISKHHDLNVSCERKPVQYQVGPVFEGVPYQTYHQCNHNMVFAQVSRATKTKGYANVQEQKKFVEWSKGYIRNKFAPDTLPFSTSDMIENAHPWIEDSSKTRKQKESLHLAVDSLIEKIAGQQDLDSFSKTFIKTEVTFGNDWPRMIAAREPGLRVMSAYVADHIAKSLYTSTNAIKNLSPEQTIDRVIEKLQSYTTWVGLDIGSYDSAQRGVICDLENFCVEYFAGKEWAEWWRHVAQANNDLRSPFCRSFQPSTRNSGEMTTSSGNTILTECLIAYAIYQTFVVPEGGKEYDKSPNADFTIEGDDDTLAYNSKTPRLKLKEILYVLQQLGFDMTVESYGTPDHGVVFCKMHFVKFNNRIIAYRDLAHGLLKLGWSDTPRKLGSKRTNKFFLAKAHSFMSMYNYWPRICNLMELWTGESIVTIKQQAIYQKQYGMQHGTNATYEELDCILGPTIDELTDIRPHSVNDAQKYLVFKDYPVANKQQTPSFIDRDLDPSFDITVTGKDQQNQNMSFQMEEQKSRPTLDKLYPAIDKEVLAQYANAENQVEGAMKLKAEQFITMCQNNTGQFRMAECILDKDGKTLMVPTFVLGGPGQILQAFSMMAPMLARRMVLIHLQSSQYDVYKRRNKAQARLLIQRITNHNGKIGFNWVQGQYQSVMLRQENWTDNQFQGSAYQRFLTEAADFYSNAAPLLAQYAQKMSLRFKRAIPAQPVFETIAPTKYVPEELKVNGFTLSDAIDKVKAAGLFDNKIDTTTAEQTIQELAQRYSKGIDDILSNCQAKYIRSLVQPFGHQSGVRIPAMNPTDTYTHSQFESFTITPGTMSKNGKIIIVFNPTAIRPRPVLVIDDSQGNFSSLNSPAPVVKTISQGAGTYTDSANKTMAIWGTGPQQVNFIMAEKLDAPVGAIFNQIDQRYAGKIRLVSAGIRIFKTSQSISEQGVIRVNYKPRGGAPQTSLDRSLETGPNSKYSVKVFPAQATSLNTRSGFLAQSVYRPHVVDDVERFYSTTQDFCSDEYLTVPFYGTQFPEIGDIEPDGQDVRDARDRFIGPMTFFGKRAIDPTWDFLNNPGLTFQDPAWRGQAGTQYAFSAYDFGRQHTSVISLEGMDGVSFDVEVVRHFELIPGEESPLELKSCQLGLEFSSPIDLIRKFKVDLLEPNPFSSISYIIGKTVWDLDPIYTGQSDLMKLLPYLKDEDDPTKVKGLVWDGLKWLLKHLAPHAVKWLTDKMNTKTRGLEYVDDEEDQDYDEGFSFETAGNDSRFADIEKNPGPFLNSPQLFMVSLEYYYEDSEEEEPR